MFYCLYSYYFLICLFALCYKNISNIYQKITKLSNYEHRQNKKNLLTLKIIDNNRKSVVLSFLFTIIEKKRSNENYLRYVLINH